MKHINAVLAFLFLLVVVISISYFSQENGYQDTDPLLSNYRIDRSDGYSWRHRDIIYSVNDIKLSKEKLLSTIWRNGFFSCLVFYKDDRFAYGGVQCGKMIAGKYSIINDYQIELESDDIEFQPYDGFKKGKQVFQFITDRKTVEYSHFLLSENVIYYAYGSQPNDGEIVSYQNIQIIKKTKDIVATDNVNIRKYPDIKAPKVDLSSYDGSIKIMKGYLLLKGNIVNQVGYYDKECTIDGKKGKWLMIGITEYGEEYEATTYGWVFSPYFNDKQ